MLRKDRYLRLCIFRYLDLIYTHHIQKSQVVNENQVCINLFSCKDNKQTSMNILSLNYTNVARYLGYYSKQTYDLMGAPS